MGIGVIIVSICVGYMTKQIYGWLCLGILLILIDMAPKMEK